MATLSDSGARGRIPAAFVRAVLAAYAARERDPAGALTQARIASATAHSATARVTPAQFERLCAHAMRELDDEALGWFSRPLPWGSYGMLARASISAATLGEALARWCRHHGLLTGDVAITLTQAQGRARVTLDERRPLCGPRAPEGQREFARLSLLRNAHGLACWFADARIALQAAEFPSPAPPHADAYATLFPGPVRFGAARAALIFDARYLALPLRRDGAALDQMLRSRALQVMVLPYRRALACDLLLRTGQPLKQIAHATGFTSDKSFARAFRLWTEQTPAAFRASHRATPVSDLK